MVLVYTNEYRVDGRRYSMCDVAPDMYNTHTNSNSIVSSTASSGYVTSSPDSSTRGASPHSNDHVLTTTVWNNDTASCTITSKDSKHRASVRWLLSKAFNNKVPENLKEPFYRDHENQEHLKPQISGALANAELYCLALGHIYSDPNYHNLNHWAILQTLSRKGVYDQDNPETEITETILIQTNPLRMNAHMAVIESIMVLYAKEVASSDEIIAAIQRIGQSAQNDDDNSDPERGLLCWLNGACNGLRQRIEQELGTSSSDSTTTRGDGDRKQSPKLPTSIQSLKDLSDGVALAALISFYCPDDLLWSDIRVSYIPSVSESLHNLMLVYNFCQQNLPCSVFHMMPEDITYMRSSMKQNLIVFLADLFNVLEIHPVKCVRYPGMDRPNSVTSGRNSQGVAHKRNLPPTVVTPIPDLRSGLDTPPPGANFTVPRNTSTIPSLKKSVIYQSASEFSEDSLFRRDSEESFVVHRNKGVPTLSSVIQSDEPLLPARLRPSKEKQNNDTKAEERGDARPSVAAGKPSNWEDSKKTSYAGRRSRRNSFSEESQLTIENFGGSQDHLNFIGRNPDKDLGVHRKISVTEPVPCETVRPLRSSIQDARGSIQLAYEEYEKQDTEKEKTDKMKSTESISSRKDSSKEEDVVRNMVEEEINNKMASFADLSKKVNDQKGIHIVYMQHDKDENNIMPSKSSLMNKKPGATNGSSEKKTTTFATLPNTTTWQQQSSSNQQMQQVPTNSTDRDDINNSNVGNNVMASQLNNIRMKLEEKRRHIESEKRRMELIMNKQRQKVGKAAFLQAVSKGKNNALKGAGDTEIDGENTQMVSETTPAEKPQRPFTLKEISDDAQSVEHKWLNSEGGAPFVETRKTPDIENMDLEQYQQSLALMNNSLHDIQADIQRLTSQQNQIQHQTLLAQQQQLQALVAQQQQFQHYASQHNISQQATHLNQMHNMFSSASHIPQNLHQQPSEPTQFYLHDQQSQPQRRTWSQAPTHTSPIQRTYPSVSQPSGEIRTWASKPQTLSQQHLQDVARYQNGEQNHVSYTVSPQPLFSGLSTPTSSPQHRINKAGVHRQISHMLSAGGSGDGPVNLKQIEHQDRVLTRSSSVIHAPVPVPSVDDMEPQNISFIGNSNDDAQLSEGLNRLNITSGTRTYRIPSPTRPSLSRTSFQTPTEDSSNNVEQTENEKGFYISFDNDQPKRPKPPLRVKRGSPKKERSGLEDDIIVPSKREPFNRSPTIGTDRPSRKEVERVPQSQLEIESSSTSSPATYTQTFRTPGSREKSPSAIIIGNEPDPNSLDEMEKKKERIMLLSLQRRQQQEEAKARKEADAAARREREKAKEEERARKKEEQAQRRAAILEQYKLKKAIEEAEREGKVLDKSEFMNASKPVPKLRGKTTGRPRPKTIHVDTGSVELAEGMLTPSRGKKGSTSNLTNTNSYNPSSMRRDYYRGSHDSLADTGISSGSLYRDSPDDGRGASPCCSVNQTLGRRASYKTSRGSSSDQDSMMYRYGDTDSGLGRATPPRRAPSPGMGPMRHLPSPSGPGSLPPGLMTKRRIFDDGCSDISSTPSSMMDYSGPRLYKQPTTKSNRGIMLNAVEYCVFPGVVNKEAKRRVLEEIARSESKHFLILFRDAGCQFRALYSYCPEREEVSKLYGTGPKQVNDRMFDKFFKYNSGGKCFSQVHTKHLTVTIDAFTIHNSLWQGKKVNLPNKKDMALVI